MLEKLAELIKEQLNYDGEVKAESNFKDDLGADSQGEGTHQQTIWCKCHVDESECTGSGKGGS